jgi:hypothetical protein
MRSEPTGFLEYAQPPRRVSGIVTAALCAAVFAAHCVLQFVLYRGRVVNRWPLADLDVVVFLLPNLLAFSAYALLLTRWAAVKQWPIAAKVAAVVAIAAVVEFFSFWGSMLIPVNTYGT